MADNWFSDVWEYIVPGEDKKGLFKNIFESDDDYDDYIEAGTYTSGTPAKGGSAESKAMMDAIFGLSEGEEATYDYPDVGTTTTGKTYTDYQDFLDMLEGFGSEDLGGGASATYGYDDPKSDYDVIWGDEGLPKGWTVDSGLTGGAPSGGGGGFWDFLQSLIGGGKDGGGIMGLGKNMLDNDLVKILLGNYLLKKDKEGSGGYVPIGQEAYGGAGQNIPDYRVTNLLPALMPGVAYANVGTPPPPPPMRQGGIAGLASREGPGDVTLAKLEPGEFVVSRPATQRIGAQNLYRMMKQAEGMG